MFLILLLHSVSMVGGDRRWQQRKTSFTEYLKAEIAIDSYTMRGRNVLINIACCQSRIQRHIYWLGLAVRSRGLVDARLHPRSPPARGET
jgi:hypothetical protein